MNDILPPDQEHIVREAVYEAARFGWYDTSEIAQKNNLLTVSVINMRGMELFPESATHRFFVLINATGYMVTRYSDHYEVRPHDQHELHRTERELRTAVLDYALWYHLQAHGIDYTDGDEKARERAVAELRASGQWTGENIDWHPVICNQHAIPPLVARAWHVQIGRYHCEIWLVGRAPNGRPKLMAINA